LRATKARETKKQQKKATESKQVWKQKENKRIQLEEIERATEKRRERKYRFVVKQLDLNVHNNSPRNSNKK